MSLWGFVQQRQQKGPAIPHSCNCPPLYTSAFFLQHSCLLRLIETLTQTFSQHGQVLGSTAYVVARININLHLPLPRFHHFLPAISALGLFTRPEERDLA